MERGASFQRIQHDDQESIKVQCRTITLFQDRCDTISMTPNYNTYNMSFTAAALLHQPSVLFASLYSSFGDWQAVRSRVLADNLLQARTRNTAHRICREVVARLGPLSEDPLAVLVKGPAMDQAHILWTAICKRYRFIHDFAVEVIHEKFLAMDLDLTYADYDVLYNQKAEWHEGLAGIRPSTRAKLRQVLFRMLREAGLLSKQNRILPVLLSPAVEKSVMEDPELSLATFPAREGVR